MYRYFSVYKPYQVLAQFSRSGVVEDLAERITKMFAQNLEAELLGRGPDRGSEKTKPLSAGFLVWQLFVARVKQLFKSVAGESKK